MMLTRCPACSTVFRVTPEQLKAKKGKVRCGQCQHIFNALDTLLDAKREEPVVQLDSAPAEAISHGLECQSLDLSAEQTQDGSSVEPVIAVVSATSYATDMPVAIATNEIPEAKPDIPIVQPQPPLPLPEQVAEEDRQPQEIEPLLHDIEETPQKHGWLWALAALLAFGLLLFQVVLQFRVELAVMVPDVKPALQALCRLLDYDLPYPTKVNLLGIEASDLHPDPQNQGQLVLTATLKNRAPFAQTLPHLELTLTDTADQPILRKILAPMDYLPKTSDKAAGFVPNSEISVNLALIPDNSINTTAAGYRLYLFYP